MRLFQIVFILFGLSVSFSTMAIVSQLEKLVMPGDLIQGHAKYEDDCSKCHESFESDQSKLCLDCHEKVAADVDKRKGFHGKSKMVGNRACKGCHTDHIGRKKDVVGLDRETFNHKLTDFELKGKHKQTKCDSCHKKDKKFREAKADCFACHKDDDAHNERLGKKCYKCHSEVSWGKIKFDHSKTDFPLKGEHEKASCESCHPDNRHKDTPSKCYACHAINDAHKKRYGRKCETCHTEKKWQKSHFNHDKKTKFKLKGRHKSVACDSCHTHKKGSIFKIKPKKKCNSCHKGDDVHRGQNGTKCNKCHTEQTWRKNKFSHNRDTKFKIKGRHKKIKCAACHPSGGTKTGKRVKLKMDCYSCHKPDDVHKGQQGKYCDNCHSEKDWSNITGFNHDLVRFPLLGQHAIIPCEECHLSSAFKDASEKCATCHKKDDSHEERMGTKCGLCHNPNGWRFWNFNHDGRTSFKLEGSHKDLQCEACHKDPMEEVVLQSTTCAVCHFQDDIHNGSFGNRCDQCHNSKKFDQNTLLN